MSTTAYAVQDEDGTILTDTIGSTVRAAKVNWLMMGAELFIGSRTNDVEIQRFWKEHAPIHKVKVVGVRVEVVKVITSEG